MRAIDGACGLDPKIMKNYAGRRQMAEIRPTATEKNFVKITFLSMKSPNSSRTSIKKKKTQNYHRESKIK
jgi:hypothetical protein